MLRFLKQPWTAVIVTWILLSLILLKVLATGAVITGAEPGADSGGRTAALVLAIVALIPLLVRQIQLQIPAWLPWAIGGLSVAASTLMWLLVVSGRDSLAWSVYGGLQVLRAKEPFNDLAWVLRSIDCGGCASEVTGYGPGLQWIDKFTLGLLRPNLTYFLGLLTVVALGVALVWLARNSSPRGIPVLLVSSLGCGWLLLLDRANLDAYAFLLPIFAVFLTRRWNSIWSWSLIALLIWVLGTWKYYPFALGVLLIPALFVKRGWIVLTLFLLSSMSYMLVFWAEFTDSSRQNSNVVIIWDFPGFGRLPIIARMTSNFSVADQPLWANVLVLLLCIAGFIWGICFSRRLSGVHLSANLLATSGALAFLAAALVAGFGFSYKSAFLLLIVPLMSLPRGKSNRFLLYTSIVTLTFIAIQVIIGYSILLTSLVSLLAASIGLGAGVTGLCKYVSHELGSRKQLATSERVPLIKSQ